jgi:hypothetical protein
MLRMRKSSVAPCSSDGWSPAAAAATSSMMGTHGTDRCARHKQAPCLILCTCK